jgi:hypothetical protein
MAEGDDSGWSRMTGDELAHILDLAPHAEKLQAALEEAVDASDDSDWSALASALLASMGADPAHEIKDDRTGDGQPRIEILADELMRAHFESEGDGLPPEDDSEV